MSKEIIITPVSEAAQGVLAAGGETLIKRLRTSVKAGQEANARGDIPRSFDEFPPTQAKSNVQPLKKA